MKNAAKNIYLFLYSYLLVLMTAAGVLNGHYEEEKKKNRGLQMKNQILIITMILLLLCVPSTLAFTRYGNIGGDGRTFQSDIESSRFNSALELDLVPASTGVSDAARVPYVYDLDNDGLKEIYFYDDHNLKVYHYNDTTRILELNSSINFGGAGSILRDISNLELTDYDLDGRDEIVAASVHENLIYVFNYSAGKLYIEQSFQIIAAGGSYVDTFLLCPKDGECGILALQTDRIKLQFSVFRGTDNFNYTWQVANSADNYLPYRNSMAYNDWNKDGRIEYIFSFGKTSGGHLNIAEFAWNYTHVWTEITDYAPDWTPSVTKPIGSSFTGVVLGDFHSNYGNEIAIGVTTDIAPAGNYDYKLWVINGISNTRVGEYPQWGAEADGYFLSNPFIANAFESNTLDDVCIMSYDDEDSIVGYDSRVTILCVNAQEPVFKAIEFMLENTLGNVSADLNIYNEIAHSFESQSSNNLDEILTTYGVFSLIDTGCDYRPQKVCSLNLEWLSPSAGVAAHIPIDYFDTGYNTILGLTNTTLIYYDDEYINEPVEFTAIIEPNIDRTIQTNSSCRINIFATDPENDNYSVRSFLYYGHLNQQTFGWQNRSVEDTIQQYYEKGFNYTTTNGVLRIEAYDIGDGTLQIEETPFIVANDGIVFYGDGTSTNLTSIPDPDDDPDDDPDGDTESSNAITRGINEAAETASITGGLVWMIFTIIVVLGTIVGFASVHPMIAGSAAVSGFLGMIFLGAKLGFVSAGFIVILVIMGVFASAGLLLFFMGVGRN